MYLKHLKLENFCQHELLDVELPVGLVGVVGPNGAGKSNFLTACYALLTNDFSRNEGVKLDNIRHQREIDQVSRISGTYEHNGEELLIVRSLAPELHKFQVGTAKAITKATQIDEEIASRLTTRQVLDNYVFVEQGHLFDFVSQQPAKRAKTFAYLCGTLPAEQLWDLLGEQIAADQPHAGEVTDDADELKRQFRARRQEVETAKKQLTDARHGLLKAETVTKLRELVASRESYVSRRRERREIAAELETLQAQRTEEEGTVQRWQETLDSSAPVLADLQKRCKAFDKQRQQMKQFALWEEQHAEAVSSRDTAEAKLSRLTKPADPPTAKEKEDLSDLRSSAQAKRAEAAAFLESFAGDESECPTCHQRVPGLHDLHAQAQRTIEEVDEQLAKLRKKRDKFLERQEAWDAWDKAYRQQHANLSAANASLESLAKVKPVAAEYDKATAAAVQSELQELEGSRALLSRKLQEKLAEVARLSGRIGALQERHDNLAAESATVVSKEEYQKARKRLERHGGRSEQVTAYNRMLATARLQRDDAKRSLQALRARQKKAERYRQWCRYLGEMREQVHRNRLPQVVAQSYLEEMVDGINATLQEFGGPFRVEAESELSFVAIKPDGSQERASRLSFGEKVILALAFRFEVNSLFAKNIGMMVLDEPTVGLAAYNVDYLRAVLVRLSKLSRAGGFQIIMVTHDERLESVFDKVIRLGG